MQELFEKVKNICYTHHFTSLYKQIESIEYKISSTDFIDIAVLGEFKSGKTSFLNSLLHENLLPTGVVPVTSVITRVYAGTGQYAKIKFLDNSVKKLPFGEIDRFVSENKNPKNEKSVLVVDIESTALAKFNKIRLIDTPGIGSIFKHNTETTKNWFSEIGLAIVAISAERPLGEDEISLIKEISEQCPETIILLTKVDLFTNEQLMEIKAYIKNILQNQFHKEFRLYEYSTVKNTEKYKTIIEEEILLPLNTKYNTVHDEIISYKNDFLVKSCLHYLEIAYKTALNNETEKQNLKEQIIEEQINKSFLTNELRLIATNQKSQTREKIFKILQKHQSDLVQKLKVKFINDYKSWNGNLYKIARKYESWIKENLKKDLIEILNAEYPQFVEINHKNKKHFQFFAKSFRDRLNSNIEKVLNVKMMTENYEIELKPITKPNISISWSFEIYLDLIWFLFPMFLFKNIFRRHFLKLIEYEVEKNIYRITSGLNEKINKLISEYEHQTLKYISGELSTIENILEQSKFKSQHYLGLIKSIESF